MSKAAPRIVGARIGFRAFCFTTFSFRTTVRLLALSALWTDT
jgi:hypothetical protein